MLNTSTKQTKATTTFDTSHHCDKKDVDTRVGVFPKNRRHFFTSQDSAERADFVCTASAAECEHIEMALELMGSSLHTLLISLDKG